MITKHTSYDTTCAIARIAPISVYFVFLPHPMMRNTCGDSLIKAITTSKLRVEVLECVKNGLYSPHSITMIVTAIVGPKRNIVFLLNLSFRCSLDINLIASDIGCETPLKTTLLGPFRKWARAMILRSIRVKNATPRRTPTIINIKDRLKIIVFFGGEPLLFLLI